MYQTRLWPIVPIVALLCGATPLRAEDDDPVMRGKKLTEWIEQMQNGGTPKARKAGLLAIRLIGPRKSRKVTQSLIAAARENTDESIRAGAAPALGDIAGRARDEDDIPIEKIRDCAGVGIAER